MAGEDVPLALADLLDRPAWMADAACREHPDLPWVPERGPDQGKIPAMYAICAGCLVRDECYAFAVEGDETGVWGGTSVSERRRRAIAGTVRQHVIRRRSGRSRIHKEQQRKDHPHAWHHGFHR